MMTITPIARRSPARLSIIDLYLCLLEHIPVSLPFVLTNRHITADTKCLIIAMILLIELVAVGVLALQIGDRTVSKTKKKVLSLKLLSVNNLSV